MIYPPPSLASSSQDTHIQGVVVRIESISLSKASAIRYEMTKINSFIVRLDSMHLSKSSPSRYMNYVFYVNEGT